MEHHWSHSPGQYHRCHCGAIHWTASLPTHHCQYSIAGVAVPLFTKSQQVLVTVSTYSRCRCATIHQVPTSTCHCQYLYQVSPCHYSPGGDTANTRHCQHTTVKPLYHFSHAPREVGYIADHCHPPYHDHSRNSMI